MQTNEDKFILCTLIVDDILAVAFCQWLRL